MKKTGILVAIIFAIIVLIASIVYYELVFLPWGSVYNIPLDVWIPWLFWVTLAQFIYFVFLGIMLLVASSRNEPEPMPIQAIQSTKKPKPKKKKKVSRPGGKAKQPAAAKKDPGAPAAWEEEEFE